MCASCPQPHETCTAVYSYTIKSWLEPLHGIFQDALQSSPYTIVVPAVKRPVQGAPECYATELHVIQDKFLACYTYGCICQTER